MTTSKTIVITLVERIWHWIHALCVVLLVLTGFHIHYPKSFALFGDLSTAVTLHNIIAIVFLCDLTIWFVYSVFTKRIRFYFPNKEDIPHGVIQQIIYYGYGIFKHTPHPFHADGVHRKFNPLQKITYAGIMFSLVPAQAITGALLLFYINHWENVNPAFIRIISLAHTALSYCFACFLIGHLYLATTGTTLFSHFKMMITGKDHH